MTRRLAASRKKSTGGFVCGCGSPANLALGFQNGYRPEGRAWTFIAPARKIIILDVDTLSGSHWWARGVIIIALSLEYFLIRRLE
ncbi:MAG: hypothetical protein IBX61_08310 [Thermoleophilia bacterium]|nr:hypothetical protein [Thermoleophilia bacterium]